MIKALQCDKHLISPQNITAESNQRIKKRIVKFKILSFLKKLVPICQELRLLHICTITKIM